MEEKDLTTEIRIKEVARKLFHEKGYAATRTRDIANEAEVNIALLNYYFRSKEQLFNIIMFESVQEVFTILKDIINDRSTSLIQKIDLSANKYIDTLLTNPHLPLFVLSEIRNNTTGFIKKAKVPQNLLYDSYLFEQLQLQIDKEQLKVTPLHIIINVISMSVMPIIAKPLLSYLYHMKEDEFVQFIDERRTFIPLWIKTILKLNN